MSGRAVAEVLLSDVRLSAERFLVLERFACWLFHLSDTHGEGFAEGGREQKCAAWGLPLKAPPCVSAMRNALGLPERVGESRERDSSAASGLDCSASVNHITLRWSIWSRTGSALRRSLRQKLAR